MHYVLYLYILMLPAPEIWSPSLTFSFLYIYNMFSFHLYLQRWRCSGVDDLRRNLRCVTELQMLRVCGHRASSLSDLATSVAGGVYPGHVSPTMLRSVPRSKLVICYKLDKSVPPRGIRSQPGRGLWSKKPKVATILCISARFGGQSSAMIAPGILSGCAASTTTCNGRDRWHREEKRRRHTPRLRIGGDDDGNIRLRSLEFAVTSVPAPRPLIECGIPAFAYAINRLLAEKQRIFVFWDRFSFC
jgi:hypothetical protein